VDFLYIKIKNMIAFSDQEKSINSDQIIEIENLIDLKLPNEYKLHLLKHNGGKCTPSQFDFIEKGKPTTSSIDWFLAIYDGEYDSLQDYINTYKLDEKRLPIHFVPIAHDAGGNLICISCGKKDYGQIFFWDHENEIDYRVTDDYKYSNIYFIAKDFNEFLNNLR